MKFVTWFLLILAVSAVAIADVFLKRASIAGSLTAALKSPWMLGAIALYLFQIFFFTYVFVSGTQLVNVGILQTALYAIIVLAAGFMIFSESLSPVQLAGMGLAIVGVLMMNLK